MAEKQYIFNKSDDNENANILIDGEISAWWGVGLRDFAKDIANSGAKNVMLQINSGGGSVFEGMAISAFIKGSPTNIDTSILGLCASIATPIAMAGKNTSIAKGSMFMIHNASAFAGGEASDLRGTADLLETIDKQLVAIYVDTIEKNGKLINDSRKETEEQVTKWQNEETWFTAEEAVEHGFIQKLTEGVEFLNSVNAKDIYNSCSKYKNVPTAFLNKVKTIADMPDNKTEEQTMFEKFKAWFAKEEAAKENELEVPAKPTEEEEKETALALAIKHGLVDDPNKEKAPEANNQADDLKAEVEKLKAEKVAAELKAQKLEEEAQGAPSSKAPETKPTDKVKTTIDSVLAEFKEDFDVVAKWLK